MTHPAVRCASIGFPRLALVATAALGLAAGCRNDPPTGGGAGGAGVTVASASGSSSSGTVGSGSSTASGTGGASASASSGASASSTSASSVVASASASSSSSGVGGGSSNCTEVNLGVLEQTDVAQGASSLIFELTGLDSTDADSIYLEFFDTAGVPAPGSYDLSQAPDDDYYSCARCLMAFEDIELPTATPFFQASGTMVVTTADPNFEGASAGQLTDVTLVEVVLDSSTHTTPVPGGRCLHITSASWDTTQ